MLLAVASGMRRIHNSGNDECTRIHRGKDALFSLS